MREGRSSGREGDGRRPLHGRPRCVFLAQLLLLLKLELLELLLVHEEELVTWCQKLWLVEVIWRLLGRKKLLKLLAVAAAVV